MVATILGSLLGGMIPSILWGASPFDLTSVFSTAIGGALGIWIGYKVNQ